MNNPDVGEQAISKAAEVGIDSQLEEVENLDVDIRANPLDLAQGKLESVTIDGQGMAMKKDLKAERLVMETDSIAIDPLKAALGDIELTQTTNAEAKIVLSEENLQGAFNSDYIKDKLKNQKVDVNGETLTVNAKDVQFTLPGEEKISIKATIDIQESSETKEIALSAKPSIDADGNKITLNDVQYHNKEDADFAKSLLDSTEELLDLRNFELEDMSLQIERIDVRQGKITMTANAAIEDFPDS